MTFNAILLGRILDTAVKEHSDNEYDHMPDEMIKEILAFTGKIEHKPKNMFHLYYNFTTDTSRYYGRKYSYNNMTPDDQVRRWRDSEYSQRRPYKSSSDCYWCPKCDKYFINNPRDHDETKRHKAHSPEVFKSKEDILKAIWGR